MQLAFQCRDRALGGSEKARGRRGGGKVGDLRRGGVVQADTCRVGVGMSAEDYGGQWGAEQDVGQGQQS